MKVDIQKNWPIITGTATLVFGLIWGAFQMHADMLLLQQSIGSRFDAMQSQIQALQEKVDMRFDFDETEINEMKAGRVVCPR